MDNIRNKDLMAEKAKVLLEIKVLLSFGRIEQCVCLNEKLEYIKNLIKESE